VRRHEQKRYAVGHGIDGVGSLMAALDTLVVSTALSTVRLKLHASVEQLEWTVNAYNLSFAVLLITGAALSDRSVGSVVSEALGKAGVNSMMRELGDVFGIAVAVAVFAATGSYASAQAFTNGFGPAIGVSAGLALAGALAAVMLPSRRTAAAQARPTTAQANSLQAQEATQ
jgi:MFS family permease